MLLKLGGGVRSLDLQSRRDVPFDGTGEPFLPSAGADRMSVEVKTRRTQREHYMSALTPIADMPGDMDLRRNGPISDIDCAVISLLVHR
jgi:hypothetical protein